MKTQHSQRIKIKNMMNKVITCKGFPHSSVSNESACSAGELGSIPGWGRCPGEGNGHPLQYPCRGESHGQRSLVCIHGSPRVGHDLATKPAIICKEDMPGSVSGKKETEQWERSPSCLSPLALSYWVIFALVTLGAQTLHLHEKWGLHFLKELSLILTTVRTLLSLPAGVTASFQALTGLRAITFRMQIKSHFPCLPSLWRRTFLPEVGSSAWRGTHITSNTPCLSENYPVQTYKYSSQPMQFE